MTPTTTPAPAGVARAWPGRPDQLAAARAWALSLLPAGCPRADDVALVVGELATNAVLHSASGAPHGTYTLAIAAAAPGSVEITVVDAGPAPVPADRPCGPGGWGLGIVAALADAYEVHAGPLGRIAWCRLDWPATPEAGR
ncbi:ATP-binding protein [Spongiactinospora sp. 9N601]|uniref:ATP-binding protein n=1 Tax=Spongiactinospora sp. 9N601 TaxID=3375149 RepID=UPI0037BE021A